MHHVPLPGQANPTSFASLTLPKMNGLVANNSFNDGDVITLNTGTIAQGASSM
jgi:hypothetical protein